MLNFIINPNARTGQGLKTWNELEKTLKERKVIYQAFLTRYRGHAANITEKLLSETTHSTLVILGGDGTINEVISKIADPASVTLAYIPIGSSNDFARGMNISHNPQEALAHILSPSRFSYLSIGRLDYGKRSRRFAVSAGFGLDAEVCCRIAFSRLKIVLNKLSLGKFSYVGIALQSLMFNTPKKMVITLDDSRSVSFKKVYFAAAMNQKYEGGGFMFCPDADPMDEYLDIIVAEGLSRLKIFCLLPTAFFGRHTGFSGIHVYRCRKAVMKSEVPLPFHTDGEPVSLMRQVSASIEPQKIQFIIR